MKYQRRGEVNQDLVDIIAMNVRLAEKALGDLRAQIVAVTTGERRSSSWSSATAGQPVHDSFRVIMDQSEALARGNTLNIPDGVYEAESLHGRRRPRGRRARADPRAGREARRGDDDRPVRRQPPGARVLQLRRHHGHRLRPGRVQMLGGADGLSGQRGQLPAAEGHHADGHGGQRRAAGADAGLDDLSP